MAQADFRTDAEWGECGGVLPRAEVARVAFLLVEEAAAGKTTARFAVEVRVEDSRTNLPVDSRIEVLWFAKISAGTKNRSGPGRVGLYTIIARYGMKTKTLKGTNPSARSAHI